MEPNESLAHLHITKKYSLFDYFVNIWMGRQIMEKSIYPEPLPCLPNVTKPKVTEISLHQASKKDLYPQRLWNQENIYWKLSIKCNDVLYQTFFPEEIFSKFPHMIQYLPICLAEDKEISFSFDSTLHFLTTNIILLEDNQLFLHYKISSLPKETFKQDFIFHLQVNSQNQIESLKKRLLELENELEISNKRLKKITKDKIAIAKDLPSVALFPKAKQDLALQSKSSLPKTSCSLPKKNKKFDSVILELHEKMRSSEQPPSDSSTSTNESTDTLNSQQ